MTAGGAPIACCTASREYFVMMSSWGGLMPCAVLYPFYLLEYRWSIPPSKFLLVEATTVEDVGVK